VFVSSGGNDAISDYFVPGSYPAEQTMHEMEKMFDDLQATGAVVLYLGLNPPYTGGERMPEIWKLAESKGVIVVDGLADLWGDKDKMSDDLHPNEEGYKIFCERIEKAVTGYYP
jgi:lysophospholipase L1-like esterase